MHIEYRSIDATNHSVRLHIRGKLLPGGLYAISINQKRKLDSRPGIYLCVPLGNQQWGIYAAYCINHTRTDYWREWSLKHGRCKR